MLNLKIKDGFYPALGTPTDINGCINKTSYSKGIEMMLDAGAKGVLCMGSMGKMVSIKNSEFPKVAKCCVEVISKKIPVIVGVMDCSAARVSDRIESLGNIEIEGVVATTPYYSKVSAEGMINFFRLIAKTSRYPVYIYDLPSVTQAPVTGDILKTLMDVPNIKGIKTANLALITDFIRNNYIKEDFSVFFSGLDLFDTALKFGIGKNLDGMFTCTPYNSKKMYEGFDKGNFDDVSKYLNNILTLRNIFLKGNVFPAYSYAMELLGCPGDYHPDYEVTVSGTLKEMISNCMKAIGEL
ncbi:MAG: dihydrodipicolinate synthase family protein [Mangrovibacterium sp.]